MESIIIKRVSPNDINELQKISKQTFEETFSARNTEENMTKYLDEVFSLDKLTSELNNINSEFYFAISDNNILGYLKLFC